MTTFTATVYARRTYGNDDPANPPIGTFTYDAESDFDLPFAVECNGTYVREDLAGFGAPVIRYYAILPTTVLISPVNTSQR